MAIAAETDQLLLFPELARERRPASSHPTTSLDNASLPVHRWFRYSAGFSALWVRELLRKEQESGRKRVLDPFVGAGTVVLEAEFGGYEGIGVEAHPFVARIARAKLLWRTSAERFGKYALGILREARAQAAEPAQYPDLVHRCFPPDVLTRLHSLRMAWQSKADSSPESELTWLLLTAILRECSPVGTAQWQYVLPRKSKRRAVDPYSAFMERGAQMSEDMHSLRTQAENPRGTIAQEDARTAQSAPDSWADLVVTSPPYLNNYDYADATRLEMCFWGLLRNWGDLQTAVRRFLLRSCTQHVASERTDVELLLRDPLLHPIHTELRAKCEELRTVREKHGGKKPYHAMAVAYFADMARVWTALRRATSPDALVCFVVGDSAPYGVDLPVERWLGDLAVNAGFRGCTFEKLRDRNTKWKNRKHRVPLQEGRLWVKG
jgi:hypothetical protein